MDQNLSGNDDIGRQDYVFKPTGERYCVSVPWGQQLLSMAAVSQSRIPATPELKAHLDKLKKRRPAR
ncbi:hypothetical protein WN73_05550 [Bradyrhizobium sp. CCBAU 45394]|nr:hypothetical protein BD122_17690 [Bradyrhizobium diazoefficiens]KOY04683.1 hypothetical protein AF336_40830 [Bradyrhizobium diazoefficiens]MDA9390182.1 hypothetical protein [Bradyrhizobium sp. CCBAU 45394]